MTLSQWSRDFASREGVFAIAGTCKNAGKTTVLGYLLGLPRGETVGVTSIGRDGEAVDEVERIGKPAVRLPAGGLVATTRQGVGAVEWIEQTRWRTPLGAVWIGRATAAASVELAGPSTREGLEAVVARLRTLGARQVLVDGAFDRAAATASSLADGVLLAVGSADQHDIDGVARQAGLYARRFSIPVWRGVGEVQERLSLHDEDLPGVSRIVLLPDPAGCFLSEAGWRELEARGVGAFVRARAQLEAVFVSSFRPHSRPLPALQLVTAVAAKFPGVPVFDLMLGKADR